MTNNYAAILIQILEKNKLLSHILSVKMILFHETSDC